MPTDTTDQQIEVMFSGLRRKSATKTSPKPGALAEKLRSIIGKPQGATSTVSIDSATLSLFASASVEMWHRSVHSFLVSASLTKASPLWASVSGYYSSHYSIRAFAHLLGYFQLWNEKRIIKVEASSPYICHAIKKNGGDREHKFYWKTVKNHNRFVNDPFFTTNDDQKPQSDSAHRSKANYVDHIDQFPTFRALDEAYLKKRVENIASMELLDVPIPNTESYPDTENVQVIAYHRMVKFRKFVDEVLGVTNAFWNTHRKPEGSPSFLDFQIIEPKFTSAYMEQL